MRMVGNTKQQQSAFTIVELLIVIVIVAILAAITIIAYSGIQTRTENNKTVAGISVFARAVLAYSAENGRYPTSITACIGPYQAPNDNSGDCANVTDTSSVCFSGPQYYRSALDTLLKTEVSVIPSLSSQKINCQANGGLTIAVSGGWYQSSASYTSINYFLKNVSECPRISGGVNSGPSKNGAASLCTVVFPNI